MYPPRGERSARAKLISGMGSTGSTTSDSLPFSGNGNHINLLCVLGCAAMNQLYPAQSAHPLDTMEEPHILRWATSTPAIDSTSHAPDVSQSERLSPACSK